jgi:hypothetical protein
LNLLKYGDFNRLKSELKQKNDNNKWWEFYIHVYFLYFIFDLFIVLFLKIN